MKLILFILVLTRAFDSVCHSKLLCKLKDIGISGSLLFLFSDYLFFRQEQKVINGANN